MPAVLVRVPARIGRLYPQPCQCLRRLPTCASARMDRSRLCGACAAYRRTRLRTSEYPAGTPGWWVDNTATERAHAPMPGRLVAMLACSGPPEPCRRACLRSIAQGNGTWRSRWCLPPGGDPTVGVHPDRSQARAERSRRGHAGSGCWSHSDFMIRYRIGNSVTPSSRSLSLRIRRSCEVLSERNRSRLPS